MSETDRYHTIITAWMATMTPGRARDPLAAFAGLAEQLPGLTSAELVGAAAAAKAIGSQLHSVAHRLMQFEADAERRRRAR